MVKNSLTIIMLLSVYALFAQSQLFPVDRNLKRTVIVKDSTGKIYTDREWMKLTTSYKFKFRQIDSTAESLTYLIVEMSDTERFKTLSEIQPEETRIFKIGKKILSFNFKDLEGTKFGQNNLKGKIVILYFCILKSPATRFEVSELNDLVLKYKERNDIEFIAIAQEDFKTAKIFSETTGFKFHIIPDSGFTMKQYDIYNWPTHVVLDKEGLVYIHNVSYKPILSTFWIDKAIAELTTGNSSHSANTTR